MPEDEFTRRSELPLKDIAAFNREFSSWLERHPELKDAGRPTQLREWLRARELARRTRCLNTSWRFVVPRS